jgi:hypothetical protein
MIGLLSFLLGFIVTMKCDQLGFNGGQTILILGFIASIWIAGLVSFHIAKKE